MLRPTGFTDEVISCIMDIFMYGNFSLLALCLVIFVTYSFADSARGLTIKIMLGLAHGISHLVSAITLFLMLEFTVETALQDGLIGKPYTKWYWRVLDLPEAVGYAHGKYCQSQELSRFETWHMYFGSFLYTYVLSADLAALTMGVYLFVSGFFLGMHWNEAYSSVRYPHVKHFCRFKVCFKKGGVPKPNRLVEITPFVF